jgi:hypothetical protein
MDPVRISSSLLATKANQEAGNKVRCGPRCSGHVGDCFATAR